MEKNIYLTVSLMDTRRQVALTCLGVPGVGEVVLTARKHEGATRGEGAVDLLTEVQRPDVLLHHPLSVMHNTLVHSKEQLLYHKHVNFNYNNKIHSFFLNYLILINDTVIAFLEIKIGL